MKTRASHRLTRRTALGALAALACAEVGVKANAPSPLSSPASAPTTGPLRLGCADSDTARVAAPVLAAAYARLGLRMESVVIPLRRGLLEAAAGRLDGDLIRSAAVIHQIDGLLIVKVPVFQMAVFAYQRGKDCPARLGWQELARHRVSILRGVGAIEMNVPEKNQIGADNYGDVLRQLREGMADYAVGSELALDLTMLRHRIVDICKVAEPLENIALFHSLNRSHADLVPRLEHVLEDMRRSGEMARIWAVQTRRLKDETRAGRAVMPRP